MSKTALITGVSGFTGQYVAAELIARGYTVHGLGRGDGIAPAGVVPHQADLLDLEGLEARVAEIQPDIVLHLAAIAFVGHNDLTDMYLSNVVGARNLLSAIASAKGKATRVLLASSANVYGNAEVDYLEESRPYSPQNDYAVSKCAMEMMAGLWRDRLPITIARPFNYTGVGQSPSFLIPKIVGHFARQERCIELGNTEVYRDFSDVRDVAKIYAALLEKGCDNEIYNICSGRAYSLRYVIDELAEMAGYEIEVKVNPAFVRSSEIKVLQGSDKKLANTIGVMNRIPWPNTLAWMYQSMCANIPG